MEEMEEKEAYEEPEIRVLGEVTDLTQMPKPGPLFDFFQPAEGFRHHHHPVS